MIKEMMSLGVGWGRGVDRQEGKGGGLKMEGEELKDGDSPSRPPQWLDLSLLMTLSAGAHRQMVN